MRLNIDGDKALPNYVFDNLEKTGIVKNAFSTRQGGVSKNEFATLNFSFTRGDDEQAVLENYRRMAEVFDTTPSHMVVSYQTHTTNVRRVTSADMGKGVTAERDYTDIDGLITNENGIMLTCLFADCVPLYLVDTAHHAIGLAHSGWRGTAAKMGQVMLEAMQREYGTKPTDVEVAIGPSICQSCYEVDAQVADIFAEQFSENADAARDYLCHYQYEITETDIRNCLLQPKPNNKYQLNLWYANYRVFRDAGVPDEHIEITDVCTCCHSNFLFSHRASHGKRGNLGAFLMLK